MPSKPAPTARQALDASMSEATFQRTVMETAEVLGWRAYHTYDSRGSQAGFPDLVLVHAGKRRIIFAELKTQRGRLSKEQREWYSAIHVAATRPHGYKGRAPVAIYIWRPSDLDAIEELLR